MKPTSYTSQAKAMLKIIPFVADEKCFALKGGTAINLFWRDMPRLSVDIDLTYLPIESREVSLQKIHRAMQRIAKKIRAVIPNTKVKENTDKKKISKLFIYLDGVQIKVEPNSVIRGVVYSCEERTLSQSAENLFEMTVSLTTVSFADLYGGKICAALDHQHPRDLFDIKLLLENEGITNEIRKAFLIYLISHDRPIREIIAPSLLDISHVYKNEFFGMTLNDVSYEELIIARKNLISSLHKNLTETERKFLLSFKQGNPQWNLLGIANIEHLPAVRWKLQNIERMEKKRHVAAIDDLKNFLKM